MAATGFNMKELIISWSMKLIVSVYQQVLLWTMIVIDSIVVLLIPLDPRHPTYDGFYHP